eukprot:697560-Prymnesium_polylepis.1
MSSSAASCDSDKNRVCGRARAGQCGGRRESESSLSHRARGTARLQPVAGGRARRANRTSLTSRVQTQHARGAEGHSAADVVPHEDLEHLSSPLLRRAVEIAPKLLHAPGRDALHSREK